MPPYQAVDEIPRWVPLWFPSGGKSHAYNLLGGKQSKLIFELPRENSDLIAKYTSEISILSAQRDEIQANVGQSASEIAILTGQKEQLAEYRASVRREVKGAKAKLAECECYIRHLQYYLRHGDYCDDRYGAYQEKRIKWQTIVPKG